MVPSGPGFPSRPYYVSAISAAYTRSIRHAVLFSNVPDGGFSPLHDQQGLLCYHNSRVRVAQQQKIRLGRKSIVIL